MQAYFTHYRLCCLVMLAFKLITVDGFSQPGGDNLVKPGATPRLVSAQFSFTEGPAADKKGNVYFTDQPANSIWKYDTKGNLSLFMNPSGRANGLYFDQKGNLLAAADNLNQLWSINPKKKTTVLLQQFEGKLFNGPNDLWVHPGGGFYFTDPYYPRPYWNRGPMEQPGQYVYYLPKGAAAAVLADTTLKKPNGIIGTPDGTYLYVADIGDSKTWRFTINPNGTLTNKTLLVNMGSDGMTIDEQGNVYLTGKGVTIVSPQGTILKNIPVDANWTANVTFGGKQRNQLFITASQKVFVLEMNVKGAR